MNRFYRNIRRLWVRVIDDHPYRNTRRLRVRAIDDRPYRDIERLWARAIRELLLQEYQTFVSAGDR